MKIKVGYKERHVDIPDGWQRITSGELLSGDKFLHCPDYRAWIDVDSQDIEESTAENFDCIIRKVS